MLFPLSFIQKHTILSYLNTDSTLYQINIERLTANETIQRKEFHELYAELNESVNFLPKPGEILPHLEDLLVNTRRKVNFSSIKAPEKNRIQFSFQGPRSFFGNIQYLKV